jgi:hypothetical protein
MTRFMDISGIRRRPDMRLKRNEPIPLDDLETDQERKRTGPKALAKILVFGQFDREKASFSGNIASGKLTLI